MVPLAFELDGTAFRVGGTGDAVRHTRTFRDVRGGIEQVALVVDDLVSLDPFVARGIRVYGVAEEPVERDGVVGPGIYLRIVPPVSWAWNMAGEPAGEVWHDARRAVHRPVAGH